MYWNVNPTFLIVVWAFSFLFIFFASFFRFLVRLNIEEIRYIVFISKLLAKFESS